MVTCTSAAGPTFVVAFAALFAPFGSPSAAEIEAVFVFDPDVVVVTLIVIDTEPETARDPMLHVTVPDTLLQLP